MSFVPDVKRNDDNGVNRIDTSIGTHQIRVEDKLYSAEKLANLHPGGPIFIKLFSGRDASQAFIAYHHRNFPHKRVQSAFIAVDTAVNYTTEDHSELMELYDRVNKVLPVSKSFAPWHFYVKGLLCFFLLVFVETYCHFNNYYNFTMGSVIGLLIALTSLNLQHDANHGSISKYPIVNRILGLTHNWIGGSQMYWIHMHMEHHMHPNDVHLDPDYYSTTYQRANPLGPLVNRQLGRQFNFWLLLPLHIFWAFFQSIKDLCNQSNTMMMSPLLRPEKLFDLFTLSISQFRLLVLPVLISGNLSVLYQCILPSYVVAIGYITFVFTLNHHFVGAQTFTDTSRSSNSGSKENSFLYKQVSSSSNAGGWWLCMLNGGVNYQIEHHLFPRVNHCHYPTIAPIVKQFCKERNIPHTHFPTIWDNLKSTLSCFSGHEGDRMRDNQEHKNWKFAVWQICSNWVCMGAVILSTIVGVFFA